MQTITTTVAERLTAARGRIARACERSGRDPAVVRLVGVTKGAGAATVAAAIAAGLADVGENTLQAARATRAALGGDAAKADWHMVGHLQTNKVRDALVVFHVIHSVDSLRLAAEIERRAAGPVAVLLEVNVAGEATKYGFAPAEVAGAVRVLGGLRRLDLRGLMTVAPAVDDAEMVRPVFRKLRLLARAEGLAELSMGMSDDFEVAVEEGATMVRLGRALFGDRGP